jgi:hypothetical protein
MGTRSERRTPRRSLRPAGTRGGGVGGVGGDVVGVALGIAMGVLAGPLACTRPPLEVELPPPQVEGPRVVVAQTDGEFVARTIGVSETFTAEALPFVTADPEDEVELRVVELAPTILERHLERLGPLGRAVPSGAAAVPLPTDTASWVSTVEGARVRAWASAPVVGAEVLALRLPVLNPCEQPAARSVLLRPNASARATRLEDDAALVAENVADQVEWYRVDALGATPLPNLPDLNAVYALDRAPDGAIFALGRVGRGTVLLRSFTGPLTLLPFGPASVRDLPFVALAAVSSSEVLLLGQDGRIDRLLTDRLEPMYRPSTPLIPTADGRIVAVGRGAVALIPQIEGGATGPNLLVEVDAEGESAELRVDPSLSTALGHVPALRQTYLGTEGGRVVPLDDVRRSPLSVDPENDAQINVIVPARAGPWRGLVAVGNGGLAAARWDGFGACAYRVGSSYSFTDFVPLSNGWVFVEKNGETLWVDRRLGG